MTRYKSNWEGVTLETLRVSPEVLAALEAAKKDRKAKVKCRSRINGLFIRGPIPVAWKRRARQTGSLSAYVLGDALWYLCGRNQNKLTFSVSNMSRAPFGLTRHDKYRGLQALEEARLIEVKRSGKRSMIVTLLCAAGESSEEIMEKK